VECIAGDVDGLHLGFADLDAVGVEIGVDLAGELEAGLGGG
jgi:hypothetical protein